jgi:2-hydroxy-3-keto-5-methylthiopentenyl-1-phosphate phosphatase
LDAWNIFCDFDGTISTTDVIDALLARHGMSGWEKLEEDWRAGRIGSRECMSGQVALLDMDHVEIGRFLDEAAIDPAFPAFIAEARRCAAPVQIVSDGLDYAISVILRRHGLSGLAVAANHLRRLDSRRWQLDSPWQAAGCSSGTCKCACVERSRSDGRKTLLIGDGASDFCAAGNVDFVFAKNRLIGYCRANGIAHLPIANFHEATALLPLLLSGALTTAADSLPERAVA